MGSPVSPIVADLFMEHFEQLAINTAPQQPKFWGRYVDDTLTILHKDHIEEFFKHINSVNPAIKFTMELEKDNCIPMLDTLIHRQPNGSLICSVYRKPTPTDQYLDFKSHHPLQHKLGVIRTLMYRADTIVSLEEDKIKEREHVKNSLKNCGYQDWVFQIGINKEVNKQQQRNKERPRAKGSVVIPYVQGISEHMARLFQSKGIRTHYKPINSLRRHLVAPKDKIPMEKRCGTVYKIPCEDCPATYVGESERALKIRLAEHRRPSSTSSPVGEHHRETKHKIDWKNVKVLDSRL